MARVLVIAAILAGIVATGAWLPGPIPELGRYVVAPGAPSFVDGETIVLRDLHAPVTVSRYRDGRHRIAAANEHDLYFTVGYVQARDRMFQMDLLRHTAWGRLAELVGDVPVGLGTTLDGDKFNRFIGLGEQAQQMLDGLQLDQRSDLEAFARGVNAWLESGNPAIEHRLLEREVEPWRAVDSLAVFRLFTFGLTHNYSREVRRLLLACHLGLEAAERIWPTEIEFGPVFLPSEAIGEEAFALPPAVVPEIEGALPGLCPQGADDPGRLAGGSTGGSLSFVEMLRAGAATSNNWVVAGELAADGSALLANDPHLPHMNPPVAWGVHLVLAEREIVGFTLAGLPYVVFGHNFDVAWGATTNNVDLQDLYVEEPVTPAGEPAGPDATHYRYDEQVLAFEVRTETFRVRGGDPVRASARYSLHGPVLNDLDPFLEGRIPVTTLRSLPVDDAGDASAVEGAGRARSADELVAALAAFDSACQSWLYADREGRTGFTSPCRLPERVGWQGTFPVPGWTSRYEWSGWVAKDEMPAVRDPDRGWLATANNRALPRENFFTTYNSDPSPPSRYLRIATVLGADDAHDPSKAAVLQADTRLPHWPRLRQSAFAALCAEPLMKSLRPAQSSLCEWDGDLHAESSAATLFTLTQNAILDLAIADELGGGADGEMWTYLQSIAHIETVVEWMWERSADDPLWDDARTEAVESRDDVVASAFRIAVEAAVSAWGEDVERWHWGAVRPFQLRHPLGGANPVLGWLLHAPTLQGRGGPETVFKNQFLRSDRADMHPSFGPVLRMVIDLGDPRAATFALAGGQSGWPGSAHYADLLEDWMEGEMHPLTPDASAVTAVVRLLPASVTSDLPVDVSLR